MFNTSSMFQRLKAKRKGKIWQLFHATDFESLMYPCFMFYRILGIFPYKINASTIKICKPRYILSTIIIGVFCVLELIKLYDLNISKKSLLKDSETNKILHENSFSIIGVFMAVIAFILSGPRMRFLQTLLELSLKLPSESYQKLSRLIHVKDILGFFFLVVILLMYMIRVQYSVWRQFLVSYIYLLTFQMDMLYMNCVCILKACFKQINDNLVNLRKVVTNGVTFLSIKLVLIVWACETGKNQAMEISSTVHDVFNSASNKQIKYEMRLFSLQLSHCENTFSAKGLTVDATLLTKMASGIITYLLILIQFLFTSSSCSGKTLKNTL
ncbi:uncharacterized protein [Temnothorax longispinosus]|uniref:uncharacterized protein isoform X2 n=1 Tax=Temnothorax longispinosus TaxID=300112 RepID=UPI003A9964FC